MTDKSGSTAATAWMTWRLERIVVWAECRLLIEYRPNWGKSGGEDGAMVGKHEFVDVAVNANVQRSDPAL